MDIPDSLVGKVVLISTASLFIVVALWVNTYPFINEGISGVTCGGKTTLANNLKDRLSPVYVFHQDKYFYPDDSPRHVRCAGLDHNNYDVLGALDMEAMARDVRRTLAGEDRAHARAHSGTDTASGKKFLIVEGFTVLNYKKIMDLCDLRYYFLLSYSECVVRRAMRLYDPPDVAGYFDECVWPEHVRHRAEIERDGRVTFLDGTDPDTLQFVLQQVHDFLNSQL